ncbi:hypothetical protein BY996DRAFT_6415387 [Phakopsora pachyrhizi]|nr:hypothetical protein BY996DRAFT_6415387 [Phakopsora pachyrhizi]
MAERFEIGDNQKQDETDEYHGSATPPVRRVHVENDCTTIINLSYKTLIQYSNIPQPTGGHTPHTLQDPLLQSLPTPVPGLKKRAEIQQSDDTARKNSPPPQNLRDKSVPSPSKPYPWKDIIAFTHATSYGNCPKPLTSPTSPSSPTGYIGPPSNGDPLEGFHNHGHGFHFDLSLFIGGMVAGVTIAIMALVSCCMIYMRRRRRRQEESNFGGGGHRLVDETLTFNSFQTGTSHQTTNTERRNMCEIGWRVEEEHDRLNISLPLPQVSLPSPSESYKNSPLSPHSCASESIEILKRLRSNSDPFRDQGFCNSSRGHFMGGSGFCAVESRTGSLSDTCSSIEAPSFVPGDDARFMAPVNQAFQASTTTLTEVSCAATIDSGSRITRVNDSTESIIPEGINSCMNDRIYPGNNAKPDPTRKSTNHLSSNIDSLINHKAFLLSMMINQRLLDQNSQFQQDSGESSPTNTKSTESSTSGLSPLEPPKPIRISNDRVLKSIVKDRPNSPSSFSGSIDSRSSHESTYWINRKKR